MINNRMDYRRLSENYGTANHQIARYGLRRSDPLPYCTIPEMIQTINFQNKILLWVKMAETFFVVLHKDNT